MRPHWLSLTTLLLLGPAALAQQGTNPAQVPPPSSAPPASALDGHLLNWEHQMQDVQTLVATLRRTEANKGFNSTDNFSGSAMYRKPNLAILDMKKEGKPEVFEKYICTGTFVYTYVPTEKKIRAYELPKPKAGQVGDDNVLALLFSIKAADAKARYDLSLDKSDAHPTGEDQYYVYIKILPKRDEDKADFAQARLVLNRQTYMPRELWFVQNNGDEVKWDIPKIQTNVDVDRTLFTAPKPPEGWKMENIPQPSVVRPKQP